MPLTNRTHSEEGVAAPTPPTRSKSKELLPTTPKEIIATPAAKVKVSVRVGVGAVLPLTRREGWHRKSK